MRQHRTIPALRLKHRSGSCGTASALPKCSIMSGCGTRIVLRGQKSLALCDRCPCFGSLFRHWRRSPLQHPVLSAFGLASAAPRSPYRHLELCGIALTIRSFGTSAIMRFAVRFVWGVGDAAPLLWARYITHFYCTVGPPSVGSGDPALPYKKLHSVWAVQLHEDYRFVSRSLFRT